MPEVHWVGTGLSTGSGLRLLSEQGAVSLWGRTEEKARRCAAAVGAKARPRAYIPADLAAAVAPGDVVVSMLPATEHATLVDIALAHGAHFACTSYTSDDLAAAGARARSAGLVVLTEAGLDPGIDHLLAHALVHRATTAVAGPATADFTSFCGGLTAVPNDFRYRFTWAPRGVLTALCSPAREIVDGEVREVSHPWEATRDYVLGAETFEVYPNRDSTTFVAQYHLPGAWRPRTFVRGTLRLGGWRSAWEPVFAVLRHGTPSDVDTLAADLLARYPMRPEDRDRVVLAVALAVEGDDGGRWSGRYVLDLVGDADENAMARTVSVPLALVVQDILDGTTPPGLHRALPDPGGAADMIDRLGRHGVAVTFTEAVQ